MSWGAGACVLEVATCCCSTGHSLLIASPSFGSKPSRGAAKATLSLLSLAGGDSLEAVPFLQRATWVEGGVAHSPGELGMQPRAEHPQNLHVVPLGSKCAVCINTVLHTKKDIVLIVVFLLDGTTD